MKNVKEGHSHRHEGPFGYIGALVTGALAALAEKALEEIGRSVQGIATNGFPPGTIGYDIAGFEFIIPLIGVLVIGWIAYRMLKPELHPLVPAISLIGGLGLEFFVDILLFSVVYTVIMSPVMVFMQDGGIDLIVMVIGIVYLIWKPGLGPVALLIAYELVAVITSLGLVRDASLLPFFVLHLILRIGAILFLISGYSSVRKNVPAPA